MSIFQKFYFFKKKIFKFLSFKIFIFQKKLPELRPRDWLNSLESKSPSPDAPAVLAGIPRAICSETSRSRPLSNFDRRPGAARSMLR